MGDTGKSLPGLHLGKLLACEQFPFLIVTEFGPGYTKQPVQIPNNLYTAKLYCPEATTVRSQRIAWICSRTEDEVPSSCMLPLLGTQFTVMLPLLGTQFLYAPTSRYPVHCHAPTSRYPVHCPRGPVHLSQSCWCGLVPVAGVVLSLVWSCPSCCSQSAGMVPVLVLMWTLLTGDWSCPSPDSSHNPIPVWSHGSLVITCWSPIQLLGWLGAA